MSGLVAAAVLLLVAAGGGAGGDAPKQRPSTCACNYIANANFQCIGLSGRTGSGAVRDALRKCFRPQSSLRVLFYNSELSDLPPDLFDGYVVKSFDCFNCNMTDFPPHLMLSFGNATEVVECVHCTVRSFVRNKMESLRFRHALRKLYFTSCNVSDVQPYAFASLLVLDHLYFSFCPEISNIRDFAFANVQNLEVLEIVHSNVRAIPYRAFWNLPSLHSLNLHGNKLHTLSNGTFSDDRQPKLQTLLLFDNPWKCDCDLQWLKHFLKANSKFFRGGEVVCSKPEHGYFSEVEFCKGTTVALTFCILHVIFAFVMFSLN